MPTAELHDPDRDERLPLALEQLPSLETSERSELLLRRQLRSQIAHLERELSELFAAAFPRHGIAWGVGYPLAGPRLLGSAELEQLRDALAERLRLVRAELASRAYVEERKRAELESLIASPEEHRWRVISNEDIGEPGCKHWHVRPRWGILGMLMGWWRVKVSSGCP